MPFKTSNQRLTTALGQGKAVMMTEGRRSKMATAIDRKERTRKDRDRGAFPVEIGFDPIFRDA